jgi:hypothetical protein
MFTRKRDAIVREAGEVRKAYPCPHAYNFKTKGWLKF